MQVKIIIDNLKKSINYTDYTDWNHLKKIKVCPLIGDTLKIIIDECYVR